MINKFDLGDIGHYYYGPGHPMKPHRLKLAHHLILSYGLYRKMDVYRPHMASPRELIRFHSEDYVRFLSRIFPDNVKSYTNQMQKFNIGQFTDDCPVFDGLFEYCQVGSVYNVCLVSYSTNRAMLEHRWIVP